MHAVVFRNFGPPSVLEYVRDHAIPTRHTGEVLVKICSTSVNPVDVKTRAGNTVVANRPKILGGDVAGIVEATDVNSKFKVGERVFGLTDGFKFWTKWGTYAQYCTAQESQLAAIPEGVNMDQAAAMPLVTLTAWQALQPVSAKPGLKVLIHGGAGGVGSVAVQLAKAWGMHVTATCSSSNLQFVKELGADEVIDYRAQRIDQLFAKMPFDAVVDPIGGDTEPQSLQVLGKHGYYSSILTGTTNPLKTAAGVVRSVLGMGPTYHTVIVQPNGVQMQQAADLMAAGKLKPIIDRIFPLQEAVQAHQYVEQTRGRRGKVVLKVTEA